MGHQLRDGRRGLVFTKNARDGPGKRSSSGTRVLPVSIHRSIHVELFSSLALE